jgi:hypothetical protein
MKNFGRRGIEQTSILLVTTVFEADMSKIFALREVNKETTTTG